jgi:hypothetical protein
MTPPNVLLNAILAIAHRELYRARFEATHKLKHREGLNIAIESHEHVKSWNSVFSGLAVITNRITPEHRDSGGCATWYDLLLSAGQHRTAYLNLDDIGAKLSYSPGTVDLICGKVLCHSMPEWRGGERICIAAFMRDMIHHRLDVYNPRWCERCSYIRMMNTDFAIHQGWKTKGKGK